jgi:uncharacterized protein YbjQ (UPF0145 family)
MILTTTNKIEGKTVTKYLGIVSSTTYSSNHATKDMSFKDMFKQEKYTQAYEKGLEEAKESAFQKLKTNAEGLKANAVIGISMDVEHIANSSYCIVTLAGTAVSVV